MLDFFIFAYSSFGFSFFSSFFQLLVAFKIDCYTILMGAFKLLAITGAWSYKQNWSFVTSYLGPISGVKPVYGEQIRGI